MIAARLSGPVVTIAGALASASWLLKIPAPPGLRGMSPVSGLCFFLCGASLWSRSSIDARVRRAGLVAAWLSAAAAVRALASPPLPMSHCAALALVFASAALLTLDSFAARAIRPSDLFSLAAGGFGFLSLAGHAFGREEHPVTGISAPTSVLLVVLSAGLAAARPDLGLAAIVASARLGGVVVRRLLAVSLVIMPLIAAAAIYGQRRGLYSASDAVALTMGFSLVVLFASVMRNAWSLNLIDEARERAEDQTRALLDQAPDAVFVSGPDGRYVSVNDAACRLLGYARDELVGRSGVDLVLTEEEDRYLAARTALAAGEVVSGEWRLRRKDGSSVPTELTAKRLADGRVQTFARDVTERRSSERDLEESRERLRLSIAELQAYSYTVSHNLRAPLRAIEGYAALLERRFSAGEPPSKETLTMLLRISDSARRLDRMIKDLLTYRIGARVAVPLEDVDLDEIFAHESSHYAELAPGALVILGPLGKVRGQPSLVHRAVAALLENAMAAIPAGRAPRVEIHCEDRPERTARLVIQDNGKGIPPERLARIFESPRQPRAEPGRGAGLAVVNSSIADIGGRLGAESTPGEGSRFWIELLRA